MNWKPILLIVIPIALIAVIAIRLKSNKKVAEQKVYHYNKDQAVNVEADTLKLKNLANELFYTGTFEPNKETKISADIQGKINVVLVDAGSSVKKGQTVIRLDNSLLQLQRQTIEVQIDGLQADVKRYTILADADAIQGVQLEKAVLGLRSAKVQRATILEQINKTSVKAPFAGIVTAKLTEEGAFAVPGIPLLQITDIATLKFTVNVPESDLKHFKLNHTYPITADISPENSLSGKVMMIGSKANAGNSFPVQFSVNNTADQIIKSGMFGKVKLINAKEESAYIIPALAIQGSRAQAQVYLIKNSRAVLHNISIGRRFENKVTVISGLSEDDVIVTSGFINLSDGSNIKIK